MAHVQIKAPHPDGGAAQIFINGIDMSMDVALDPLVIDLGDTPSGRPPVVIVALCCDPLELDLPAAVVEALAVDEKRGEVA